MIRYIITDAGNVLTRFSLRARVVREIMYAFGIDVITDTELSRIFESPSHDIGEESFYEALDTGKLRPKDIYKKLALRYKLPKASFNYPLFFSLWCKGLAPIDPVVNLYARLQRKFPLILVSNGDAEGVHHLMCHLRGSHGLCFEGVFISGERGKKKPFLLHSVKTHIELNGVSLSDCVFIDDIELYVNSAINLGMKGIHFNANNQNVCILASALKELGFFA